MLFERIGIEDELASGCVALRLTVDSLEDTGSGKHAKGSITIKDYIEHGITFDRSWSATQDRGGSEWRVIADPDDPDTWTDRDTHKTYFTMNSAVDNSVKRYVAEWLDSYQQGEQSSSGPPMVYGGEMHTYEGKCVCVQLMLSNADQPFPWDEMTDGGRFPRRCFKCSCGNNWYCLVPNEHVWAVVTDPEALQQVLAYDGDTAEALSPAGGAYIVLRRTMVDRGYIPLP